MLEQPVISARDAGGGIGHRFRRAVAGHSRKTLPICWGQRVRVLHGVGFSKLGLKGEDEIVARFGRGENDRRGPDPEAALNGKTGAGRHGGERLGNGAAQLKADGLSHLLAGLFTF